jgi:hypothetical protein
MARASMLGPFQGYVFSDFLLALCKQLSLVPILKAKLSSTNDLGPTKDFVVPYFAPVNATFSAEFSKIDGIYSGTIISPKDKTEIDGVALPDDIFPANLLQITRVDTPTLASKMADNLEFKTTNISEVDSDIIEAPSEEFVPIDGEVSKELVELVEFLAVSVEMNNQEQVGTAVKRLKGLAITSEMKNHVDPMDKKLLLSCCKKAINFGQSYFVEHSDIKKHIHLVFTAQARNWRFYEWKDRSSEPKQETDAKNLESVRRNRILIQMDCLLIVMRDLLKGR